MGEQLFTGADPGFFFRRRCTRLLLYFNTNRPHSFLFFCRIPVVLENRGSSQGGGVHPLHPPPRSAPVFIRQDCVTSTCCCVYKSCYLYYLLCRQNKSEEEQHQFWKAVQCTVDKDVVRTDRSHPYFSGDNNPNVAIMRY